MSIVFHPKVSIVIPVYRGEDYLREAIDSALAQTYPNIEVLVVNDGSNDNGLTEAIARSYGDRIRYFSKPNGGVATALNMAIEHMSGEYFSWLSHDDLYVPEKVAAQIAFLATLRDESRARAIVYSDYFFFTSDANNAMPVAVCGVPPQNFRYWITVENSLHGCTLLIPKSAFAAVGTFDASLRTTQDYDLWFRMGANYDFHYITGHLVKARSHAAQGSIALSGIAKQECNVLLSGFARSLTKHELLRDHANISIAYAKVAGSMWYRGFTQAGWVATGLMVKHFSLSTWASNITAARISLKGMVLYCIMSHLRSYLKPQLRRRIINKVATMNRSLIRTLKSFVPVSVKRAILQLLTRTQATQPTTSMAQAEGIVGADTVRGLGLKQKFSTVYEKNIFAGSVSRSGEGSDLVQTEIIRREIPKLVTELGIKTFLDAPCGDWYWMQHVELPVEHYIGTDIVEALIAKNQMKFGSDKVSFRCINLAEDAIPRVDLIFSRDCLVHLSFADALKIISNFKCSGATYLLATTFPERPSNEDLGDGFWRPLNKQVAPFNFPTPLRLINEGCTEGNKMFTDKCLGLWRLADIQIVQ